jgi:adenosine kinase
MSALICGSIAYDTIMVYPGRFADAILPDRVHILNVAFNVPKLRREFGGCAGNIAYNLKLLGGQGAPMGTIGLDFAPYGDWLDQHGIERGHLLGVDRAYTAQAFITTDLENNQITSFHPGAMDHSYLCRVPRDAGITLGVVAPDSKRGMVEHAEQFFAQGIPFLFDPGQAMPLFDGAELEALIEMATWVAVNDYESQMLQERTGLTLAQLAERVEALIVTWGAKGSVIYADGGRTDVGVVPAAEVVDPTGCGDAYRAGLIHGLMRKHDWQTVGNIAALMGSIKIASPGTQNHAFTPAEFWERFERAYGYRPEGSR